MSKSTLFIAVQCCQCSTMQVKQQKKSSNKWNCVVCNQKQSVNKVYAQGYQAKDIRNVVQSFNMSRKLEDDQLYRQQFRFVERLEDDKVVKVNARTDWSEYVEDESDAFEPDYLKSDCNDKEMADEPLIVTEDLMFKKPKLKGRFDSSFRSGDKESYKPNLSNRVSTKETAESRENSPDHGTFGDEGIVNDGDLTRGVKKHEKISTMMKSSASKWAYYKENNNIPKNIGRQCERQQQRSNKLTEVMKAGASKWNTYITDEDDDNSGKGGKGARARPAFSDDLSLMFGNNELGNEDIDQLVEEDIHPDFM